LEIVQIRKHRNSKHDKSEIDKSF